jgi:ribosome biogenesis GTPase
MLPGGGMVIDTPGMRLLGLWGAEGGAGLREVFGDIEALAATCRFGDCRHQREPGCAVRAAIEEGALDAHRLDNLRKLERESAHHARRADAAARQAYGKELVRTARAYRQRSKIPKGYRR